MTEAKKIAKTDEEWREQLTPEQYEVLRRQGTERPFSDDLYYNKESGMYRCAGCGADLFSSEAKFESGTGWPSFFEPAISENIEAHTDESHGMVRTEVRCKACGGHLGHVFPDGPNPTGLRYCINGCALDFHRDGAGAPPQKK
jgi:peptide-methionine (R)-S-oxide reductase